MPENFKQLVKTMILAAKQKESLTPEVLKMIFTHAAIHWFDGFEAGERISLSNDTVVKLIFFLTSNNNRILKKTLICAWYFSCDSIDILITKCFHNVPGLLMRYYH